MTEINIDQEIEDLQAKLAQLQKMRSDEVKEETEPTAKEAREETVAVDTIAESHVEDADISEMFQELVETVDAELKEASPMTVLVVFALGLIAGRLLPR